MRYYIFSSNPCALFLNDKYLGIANGNLSYFESKSNFNTLRLTPKNPNLNEIIFCELSQKEHANVQLIDLYGDFLIIPTFSQKTKLSLNVLFDKQLSSSLRVSVVCFGELKVVVENVEGIVQIPISKMQNPSTEAFVIDDILVAVLKEKDTKLLVFDISKEPRLLFFESGNKIIRNDKQIQLFKNVNLVLAKQIVFTVALSPFSVTCAMNEQKRKELLPEQLIPYAFFESIQYGFEYERFLHQQIFENRHLIPEFLGEFKAVIPLPQEVVAKKSYALLVGAGARVVETTLLNGLICDLSIL